MLKPNFRLSYPFGTVQELIQIAPKQKRRRKKTPGTFENLSPASNLHWAAMTRRVTWALANSFYKAGIMLLDVLFYFIFFTIEGFLNQPKLLQASLFV